jgi:hypothetical protein
MVYVSVTGLTVRHWRHWPRFWWHAIPSFRQASKAPGIVRAEVRAIDGVQHTLTVWTDREAMKAYLVSGSHLKAMKSFRAIATGKTVGYWAEDAPTWEQALERWRSEARDA